MISGRINIYLGGTMNFYRKINQYHKATNWRQAIGHDLLDYNENVGYKHFGFFDPTENSLENFKTANNKTVLHQNNYYLNNCDIMVLNLEDLEKSPGTIYELYYYGTLGRTVIAFGENEWINSPHIAECITVCLPSASSVIDYLDSYYGQ